MNGRIEQLQQLVTCTWDGHILSKLHRDELVKSGHAEKGHGFTWLTEKGVKCLVDLDILKPNSNCQ